MVDRLKSETCAEYLKALAEPSRLQIVDLLRAGPQTVSEVADHLGIELQNASHHLRVLLHADLVVSRREGRFTHYSINPKLMDSGKSTKPDALDFGCCRIELESRRSNR